MFKKNRMKKIIVFLIFVLGACYVGNAQNSSKEFFGMWNLEIEDGAVGWLHVFENNGFLDAELLWRGGSVTPVSSAFFFDENTLMVTRSREIVRTGEEGENGAGLHLSYGSRVQEQGRCCSRIFCSHETGPGQGKKGHE